VIVCLDSWAVLRWLEGVNPAATRVEKALRSRPVMSWINLGEVFYVIHRAASEVDATEVVRDLRHRLEMDLPDERRILEAATIKARHAVAYADAFAVATAVAHGASLMTGDPEILDRGDPSWPTIDVR
jgi:predicted nucleic acid-binding protein